jgi:6-phosphogluconolactonase
MLDMTYVSAGSTTGRAEVASLQLRSHFMTRVIRALTLTPVLVALSTCGGTSGSSDPPPTDYRVGGTVNGLSGSGLILELNGGSELPIGTNGAFTFASSLSSGSSYSVTIKAQPAVRHEICTVANGSGMVGTNDISDVSVSCTIAVGFAYVPDSNSQIAAYGITPGTGAPIPDGSFAIPPSGGYIPSVRAMVAAPSGKFLYILGNQPNQISTFAIEPNQGGLTPINAPVAIDGGPVLMAMSPNSSFLFVYKFQSQISSNQVVQTFTVDGATGALTPAGTVELPNTACTATSFCPGEGDFAIRSDGKYLYVLTYDGVNSTTSVTPYAIDPVTGGLTGGAPITFPTNAVGKSFLGTSMSIDPLGRFLYVANSISADGVPDHAESATVVSYSLDPVTGALAASSSTVVGNGAGAMAADPTGKYLYVIHSSACCAFDSNILAHAVDPASGALSQIGTTVPITVEPQAYCDPSGAFLFLSDLTSFTITRSGVNAGAVSLSGQGVPTGVGGPEEVVIVE